MPVQKKRSRMNGKKGAGLIKEKKITKELQTDLNTHGTKIDGAQFFIQLQKEDND